MSKKITQQHLADIVGVTRPTINAWLKNTDKVPLGAYRKFKEVGIDIENLPRQVDCDRCNGSGKVDQLKNKEIK